jgi:hypothetical protein
MQERHVQDVARIIATAEAEEAAKYTVHKCMIEKREPGVLSICPQP